jgi:hypothetical protein
MPPLLRKRAPKPEIETKETANGLKSRKSSAKTTKKQAKEEEAAPPPSTKSNSKKRSANADEPAPKAKPKKVKTTEHEEDKSEDDLGPHFWLMKAEPEAKPINGVEVKFSIDMLQDQSPKPEPWNGVRNHQAKNHMLAMKKGELAFFYHSNAKPTPGIAGIMEIVEEATPDGKLHCASK